MSPQLSANPPRGIDGFLEHFAAYGWALQPHFLSTDTVQALAAQARHHFLSGGFKQAGIGRADQFQQDTRIRKDFIAWIDGLDQTSPLGRYQQAMAELQQRLNQAFFLGLHDQESHFAYYPVGAFYKRHVDRFQDSDLRTVSAVLYLNRDWQAADGGYLRMWDDNGRHWDIAPEGGTLVIFESHRFPHEVLTAKRPRYSITGWFRRRADNSLFA